MFIRREQEIQFLTDKYHEKRGQLIVLYGRHRIGKIETLREFCKDKPHVFFPVHKVLTGYSLPDFQSSF